MPSCSQSSRLMAWQATVAWQFHRTFESRSGGETEVDAFDAALADGWSLIILFQSRLAVAIHHGISSSCAKSATDQNLTRSTERGRCVLSSAPPRLPE